MAYDVIVIGGGPGGYVCAIRAAQLGLKVACVEGRGALGGTCLNVGCIPSKALLHATELYHEAHVNFAKMGLMGKSPSIDVPKMMEYKQGVIDGNTQGIEFLSKKNKVEYIKGWGQIQSATEVRVGDDVHQTRNIVIATGSEPASLPGIDIDEKHVVTSTGALELKKVPKRMVVIGAGVIGLEMGSVFARLGAEVTVLEYLDHITPGMDAEISKAFQRILKKQGFNFALGSAVSGVKTSRGKSTVSYKRLKDGSSQEIEADIVLVATGRKPYTAGLGLSEIGVETNDRGQVETDAHWRTNVPNIFAIGDVASMNSDKNPQGHPMMAQPALQQGKLLAKNIVSELKNKPLKSFEYNDKGSMATIGRNKAVVDLNKWKFQGFFAWFVWMFVHLFSLIGFRNKAIVFLNWVYNYIRFDRETRLIIRPYKKK